MLRDTNHRESNIRAFLAYLCVCLVIIAAAVTNLSSLAQNYNTRHMELITGLMAEKMNNAISYLMDYAKELELVMHTDKSLESDMVYQKEQYYLDHTPFSSMGLADEHGFVYGNVGDTVDIKKYHFTEYAHKSQGTYLTEPYRSSTTGKMSMIIFVPILEEKEDQRYLFMTFPLEVIQAMAGDSLLKGKANVFLMNAWSENYVSCIDSDEYIAGVWNNLMLSKSEMTFYDDYSAEQLVADMREEKDGMFAFGKNKEAYTVSFHKIFDMPNWYVLVEIRNSELADLAQQFSKWGIVYGGALLLASALLAFFIIHGERKQKKLFKELSTVDPLTKLQNRRSFDANVMKRMEEKERPGVLVFLDLDNFKTINDSGGHESGDQVLTLFADKMRKILGESNILGRYGGDEFVAFLEDIDHGQTVDQMLRNLQSEVAEIHLDALDGITISFSAGAAKFPGDAETYERLCKKADIAVYKVKEAGKATHRWFE